jgi:NitT/TauT family transport system ATP-binding protein
VEVGDVGKIHGTAEDALVALENVAFRVAPGEFLAVVGPSGCGKSTLLMAIAGLDLPTSGEIRVGERRVQGPVTDVGIVFQTDVLLDWRTVLDNILLQIEMRHLRRADYLARAHALLASVNLADFASRHPFELSGGMRQRAAICRALIHDPPLLLMDEPFGALDALTREQMSVELHRIWQDTGKTVVFVTHDIQEAVYLADRVLVMTPRPGRIAEIVEVGLPRPRASATRETPEFAARVARIRHVFEKYGVLEKS